MQIKKYKLSAIIALSLLTASCGKDYVDLTPPTSFPVENFYKTEADFKVAVTGIYGSLRTAFNEYYLFNEVPSDNTQSEANSEVSTGAFDKLTWLSTTTNVSNAWNNHYNTIAQCNSVLEKIDGITFSNNTTKAQYIAEAKFIRALMYFNLVRYFGDVPLILNVIKNEEDAYKFTRNTSSEVFAQIEQDLKDAEPNLPLTYTSVADKGRVTAGAVKAFLGKVYLQQKKYSNAETKLREVVGLGQYELLSNYAGIFSTADEFNKEIIFTVQYSRAVVGLGEGSPFAVWFVPNPSGNSIITTGPTPASFNLGTSDLYNTFETGDVRKGLIGTFTKGATFYYTKKFQDQPPLVSEGENNWIVIRYADVLLMLAEALNEQNKPNEAMLNVKAVRTRAGLLTSDVPVTQVEARDVIKKERRVELCFEGSRWPDLIRWNDYVTVMTKFKTTYNVSSMSIVPERKLFPIPFRETTLNPKIVQNPGY